MKLTDKELGSYVANKLALPGDERNEYRQQVNRLLEKLESVLARDGSYRIQKFRRAGSLEKGTSNRPRAGRPVDADVGVYFRVDDTSAFDIAGLQQLIKKLLVAAYPQKNPDDFEEGARVFGVVFKGTGLEVDLVPIVSLDSDANYGLQYSRSGTCVKTSVKVHIDHYRAPRWPRSAPRSSPADGETLAQLAGTRRHPVVPPRAAAQLPDRPRRPGHRARGEHAPPVPVHHARPSLRSRLRRRRRLEIQRPGCDRRSGQRRQQRRRSHPAGRARRARSVRSPGLRDHHLGAGASRQRRDDLGLERTVRQQLLDRLNAMTVTLTDTFNRDDIRRVYASFAADYKIAAEWTGLHAPAFVTQTIEQIKAIAEEQYLQEVHLQLKTSAGAIRHAAVYRVSTNASGWSSDRPGDMYWQSYPGDSLH